jgi:hypothetical protein
MARSTQPAFHSPTSATAAAKPGSGRSSRATVSIPP